MTTPTTDPATETAEADEAALEHYERDQRFALWELDVIMHLRDKYQVEGCWIGGTVSVRWIFSNRLPRVANGMDGEAKFTPDLIEVDAWFRGLPVLIRCVRL